MTRNQKLKYCAGCRDNFYNGHNNLGVKECWMFKDARVTWRKKVDIHQQPPWMQKPIRALNCFHQEGYIMVGPRKER